MESGLILSLDTPVARFIGRRVEPLCPELAPLCFTRGGDLALWLEQRMADQSRMHVRTLVHTLGLPARDNLACALRCHAACVTDTYWLRLDGEEDLRWADVRPRSDTFAALARTGQPDRSYTPAELAGGTPELTNTGSFEKCWVLRYGRWWMQKIGSEEERFSEVFIARLGRAMGFPMAQYEDNPAGYVESPDFTRGLNLEPISYLVLDDEDSERSYRTLLRLSPAAARQYLDLLCLDALVLNTDRHTLNYGVLRDPETGAVVSLAPNYDNNIALLASRSCPRDPDSFPNPLLSDFLALLEGLDLDYTLPPLRRSQLELLAEQVMPYASVRREDAVRMVWSSYRKLADRLGH